MGKPVISFTNLEASEDKHQYLWSCSLFPKVCIFRYHARSSYFGKCKSDL